MILNVWNLSGKPLKIKLDLRKYGLKELKVLYPVSLKTAFSFDATNGQLTLEAPVGYFARSFIGTLE